MKDLEQLYRQTPKLASPADLDERILRAARVQAQTHTGANAKPNSRNVDVKPAVRRPRWWWAGQAVATLSIFAVGLGVVLQSSYFPLTEPGREPASADAESAFVRQKSTADIDVRSNETAIGVTTPGSDSESAVRRMAEADANAEADAPAIIQSSRESTTTVTAVADAGDQNVKQVSPGGELVEEQYAESAADSTVAPASPAVETLKDSDATGVATDSVTGLVEQVVSESTVPVPLAPVPLAEPESETTLPPTTKSTLQSDRLKREASVPESASITAAPLSTLADQGEPDWLFSQPASGFTIQLGVAESESQLIARAAELEFTTQRVQLSRDPSVWVLLHGSFADKATADQALVFLTDLAGRGTQSQVDKPVVVSIEGLQSAVE